MAVLGTLGLGLSSEEVDQPGFSFSTSRSAVVGLALLALLAALIYGVRLTSLRRRKIVADARATSSVRGLQVRY